MLCVKPSLGLLYNLCLLSQEMSFFAHHIMFLCREMHWKSYTMYLSQLPELYVDLFVSCSLLLVWHYVYRFFALVHSWRASWKLSCGRRFFYSILLFWSFYYMACGWAFCIVSFLNSVLFSLASMKDNISHYDGHVLGWILNNEDIFRNWKTEFWFILFHWTLS